MKKGIKYIIITTAVIAYGWFLFGSLGADKKSINTTTGFSFVDMGSVNTAFPVFTGNTKIKQEHRSTFNKVERLSSVFSGNYIYTGRDGDVKSSSVSASGLATSTSSGSSSIKYNNEDQSTRMISYSRVLSLNGSENRFIFSSAPSMLNSNLVDVADYNSGDITHPGGDPGTLPCIPIGDGMFTLIIALGIFIFIKRNKTI